jgi:cytochrome b6-f complex iron-sulfur subunit
LQGFKCPCHGSRYFRDAINFFGPAPRPMDRILVEKAPDGRLFIDRSVIVDRQFRLRV